MVFEKFALKAACLAATILLAAACETPVDEGKQSSGTGGTKQETQVAKSGQDKKTPMEKAEIKPSMENTPSVAISRLRQSAASSSFVARSDMSLFL